MVAVVTPAPASVDPITIGPEATFVTVRTFPAIEPVKLAVPVEIAPVMLASLGNEALSVV
jgi:hypothetical protein